MWAYAGATIRQATRSPFTWVLAVVATFTGWFGASAAILALDEVGAQGEPLIFSTCHLAGVLLTLWLLGRTLEEDRHAGFAAAADAAAPGVAGRLLGRWLGAVLAATALAVALGYVMAASSELPTPQGLSLLITSIQPIAMVGAWLLLLRAFWQGVGPVLVVFLLYILGHLPLRALGAWLPGPREAGSGPEALGYTSAAVAGLLLGALALSRSSDS